MAQTLKLEMFNPWGLQWAPSIKKGASSSSAKCVHFNCVHCIPEKISFTMSHN